VVPFNRHASPLHGNASIILTASLHSLTRTQVNQKMLTDKEKSGTVDLAPLATVFAGHSEGVSIVQKGPDFATFSCCLREC
jgi:hypothetical protein